MKPLLALTLALVMAASAGCFGYPPGSVRPGDHLTVTVTATPLAGGAPLVTSEAWEIGDVGSGSSGLGADVEQALVGHRVNETVTLDSPATARSGYSGTQHLHVAETPPNPIVDTAPQGALVQYLGHAVQVGGRFELGPGLNATVTAIANGTVTYRADLTDGFVMPIERFGLEQIFHIHGGNFTVTFEPLVGHEFVLADSGGSTPLGTPPGYYRTSGKVGDNITYDFEPASPLHGQAVHVTVKINSIEAASPRKAPADGQYGLRRSPQLGSQS